MASLLFIVINICFATFGDNSIIDLSPVVIDEITNSVSSVSPNDEFGEYRNQRLVFSEVDMMFLGYTICGFLTILFI